MPLPLTTSLRRSTVFMRTVASVVLAAFLSLTLQPLALAAQAAQARTPAAQAAPDTSAKLAKILEELEDKLDKLETKLTRKQQADQEKAELKALKQRLTDLDQAALDDFAKIEQHLKDHKLPQVILDRHHEAVRKYRADMAALKTDLEGMDAAKDDDERRLKAGKAKRFLKAKQKKRWQKFDPNDLPHKSLQPNPENKPKLKKEQFTRAGLHDNPQVKLASHGGAFAFDQLAGANDPAYLAETAEVTLTDAIQAKAAELEHHPVKIYNWVRNSVEWLPTWGATQDADVTLGSLRGNAMDIASLTIALLRASGIPARYVHGTIEVPEDKFRNWAGGFTDITAAANFASSGGIPITAIVSGGRVTKVRLEHVWVEAAIDFEPSRGAINKAADSWASLDPSYKLYEDLPGLDVVQIAGIDPAALAQSFAASGTVNEQEGWVQNLNLAILQNAQAQAQSALETHIRDNLTNPTVGDVIGGRKIIAQDTTVLPAGQPYRSLIVGNRYGTLPTGLQHRMTFGFGVDPIGEPVNPVTFPWSRLNNHKVTLSFRPATSADEQALASLLPVGQITDPSQVPSSIPSYLIAVIPEIIIDGQVMGQGYAMRLGEDFKFYYGIERVNGQGSHSYTYAVPAGSYLSIAVVGGSISSPLLQSLSNRLQQTRQALESGDTEAITGLTREGIMGDTFFAGTLGYFSQYIADSRIASLAQQARHGLPYAYGSLGYEPNVQSFFGFPRSIKRGGVAVNVRLAWNLHPLDGDGSKQSGLNLQTGMLSSALEHFVLEQMFHSQQRQTHGISAVKALQIASQQGQRIYHITSTNASQALPNLHLDGLALTEIEQALSVGREVIVHTDRVSVPGFTGEGYILFDPATGGGAYKITGGSNGGDFSDFLGDMNNAATVFGFLAAIAAFALIGAKMSAGMLLFLSNALAVIGVVLTIWYVYNQTGSVASALVGGLAAVVAALYIGAVVNALVWSIALGTGVIAAVAFLFVVTVIISAILALLIWLLTANLDQKMRKRMYAHLPQWKTFFTWASFTQRELLTC